MGTAVKVPNKGRIYYWGGLRYEIQIILIYLFILFPFSDSGQYPGYPVNTTTVLSITSPVN